MTQNNISRLESPDYGKQTLTSLKKIAAAFDVALVVRFVPFTQYADWITETRFVDEGLRPEALAVASFQEEDNLPVIRSDGRISSNVTFINGQNMAGKRHIRDVEGGLSEKVHSAQIEARMSGQHFVASAGAGMNSGKGWTEASA